MNKIGIRIARYLKDRGISQTWLFMRVDLSRQSLNAALHGKRCIKVEEYAQICKALDVPLDTFLKEDGA